MTNLEEYGHLLEWFSGYYTIHEQKYRRLAAMNLLTDIGTDPNMELTILYSEAEVKRARIQELEKLFKSVE